MDRAQFHLKAECCQADGRRPAAPSTFVAHVALLHLISEHGGRRARSIGPTRSRVLVRLRAEEESNVGRSGSITTGVTVDARGFMPGLRSTCGRGVGLAR